MKIYTRNMVRYIHRSEESKENSGKFSPTNNILFGNYRLRRVERCEDLPTVSFDLGEI